MEQKQLLSFVIPCYRSENTITGVVEEIITRCGEHRDEYDLEIILVCDCSPDNVWQVIKGLADKYSFVRGILFARNFGQHAALLAGYGESRGDIVITCDDDGQSPLESAFDLAKKVSEGYDVVYGQYPSEKRSFFRGFGSELNSKMSEWLLDKPKGIKCTSFYAMNRMVADEMTRYDNAYPYLEGLIMRTTRTMANIPVAHRERREGRSGYTLKKLIGLMMNGFTAFSVVPLRMADVAGVICAFIGFVFAIYTVINKFIHPDVPIGYSSVMAVLLLVGGIIMVILGLIGEYIGRIYICINKSPQYVVREKINTDKDSKRE